MQSHLPKCAEISSKNIETGGKKVKRIFAGLVPDRIELSTEGLLDLRSTAELRDHRR